jgi:DNA-directed RNA polymerase specialized sigma24 family protein
MSVDPEFEKLVKLYYQDLYRFGLSLTRSEADACDLTQQTFYIWANKGHQLKDLASVKAWLFIGRVRIATDPRPDHGNRVRLGYPYSTSQPIFWL